MRGILLQVVTEIGGTVLDQLINEICCGKDTQRYSASMVELALAELGWEG